MGNPPTHLPGSLRHSPRGSLETGIGVCGQGGNRGHLCLLHPHSLVCPGTRWKQFTRCWWCQGLRLTVAWTSCSPEALARTVGLRPQAPTLSFLLVFPSRWVPVRAAKSLVYGELEPVLRGQQQEMGSSDTPNHLLPGCAVSLGKLSARITALGVPLWDPRS